VAVIRQRWWFFLTFGVTMLFSHVLFIFLYFCFSQQIGISSFGFGEVYNFYYVMWLQHCLIFHIKKSFYIVKDSHLQQCQNFQV